MVFTITRVKCHQIFSDRMRSCQNASLCSSASTASASTMHHQSARIIPRLEDKYEISAGLDELVATETHSEASYARYLIRKKLYFDVT